MKLTVGCGAYDRTWPLIASLVTIPGYPLDWKIFPTEEIFLRGMINGEFDVSEMSLSTYLLQQSRGECRYRALPVFVSRKFRHGSIYVRASSGIDHPEQLRGARIGVPEYQLTANVWARGMLSDEYGVAARDVEWHIGGMDEPGRGEKVPLSLPDAFRVHRLEPGETLWDLLCADRIDGIIAPRAPAAFVAGDRRIRRLFEDPKAAEKAYFRKTGLFPLMHVIGLRNGLVESEPRLPALLAGAFETARKMALASLHQTNADAAMLPWQEASLRETHEVMGDNYWGYGLRNNAKEIAAMTRYVVEQGMVEQALSAESLFVGDDGIC